LYLCVFVLFLHYVRLFTILFLADRTNGRAIGTALRPSVVYRRLSVTLCTVAKRCVLEQ